MVTVGWESREEKISKTQYYFNSSLKSNNQNLINERDETYNNACQSSRAVQTQRRTDPGHKTTLCCQEQRETETYLREALSFSSQLCGQTCHGNTC